MACERGLLSSVVVVGAMTMVQMWALLLTLVVVGVQWMALSQRVWILLVAVVVIPRHQLVHVLVR